MGFGGTITSLTAGGQPLTCSLSENKSTEFFVEFSGHHLSTSTTGGWPQVEETRNAAYFGWSLRLNTGTSSFTSATVAWLPWM